MAEVEVLRGQRVSEGSWVPTSLAAARGFGRGCSGAIRAGQRSSGLNEKTPYSTHTRQTWNDELAVERGSGEKIRNISWVHRQKTGILPFPMVTVVGRDFTVDIGVTSACG